MFYHAILGLLRDGRARHGYELALDFRARSGRPVNPGNFYRECSKLVAQGLIALEEKSPEADPRRIPYRITPGGCRDFDQWLLEPRPLQPALDLWMMFADMLVTADRARLLNEMRERLWAESKALGNPAGPAARGRRPSMPAYRPAAYLAQRRLKQISAELEFLQEYRRALEQAPPAGVTVVSKRAGRADLIEGSVRPTSPMARNPRRM